MDRDIVKYKIRHRKEKLRKLLEHDQHLAERLKRVRNFSAKVRVSEYHLTNACNIRCQGCWFFEFDFDKNTKENTSMESLKQLLLSERRRGINTALIIGGEPTLFPRRIDEFIQQMSYVTISTNGLKALPYEGFEDVTIAVSLFSGGKQDDELRAIKPNGKRFSGLFDTALSNYKNDSRTIFIYAVTEESVPYIEETVKKIRDNGNLVNFNYYCSYDKPENLLKPASQQLLDKLLEVQSNYPETVLSHPYYLKTMVTGQSHWGEFGYAVCPSISVDHPDNQVRISNGNSYLPRFNTYAADYESLNLCCTSGQCTGCRDSQAVLSWLLVNFEEFLTSKELLKTWVEIAELYWRQFYWSPYHYTKKGLRDTQYANAMGKLSG